MKYADLHIHTYYSDSTLSPEDVIKLAEQSGINAVSVTDHDTIDSLQPLLKLSSDVEVIPGVELSTEIDNTEIHILGYFIDWQNSQLRKKLEEIKEIRKERVYKFKEKLETLKVSIEPEKIINSAKCGTVGRVHIAKYLLEKKYVSSLPEAFRKYLGDKAPGYISAFRLKPHQAIQLLKSAGGIPVLAHPYSLSNQGLIKKLIDDGLMGLEVYYPEHNESKISHYKGIAKEYSLLMTGGSDCHGALKSNISVGTVRIPYELVEKLKEARNKLVAKSKNE